MENAGVTLGEIKAYCEENGIDLVSNKVDPTVVSNIQAYGDINAEEYFTFYEKHKDVIDDWISEKRFLEHSEQQSKTL